MQTKGKSKQNQPERVDTDQKMNSTCAYNHVHHSPLIYSKSSRRKKKTPKALKPSLNRCLDFRIISAHKLSHVSHIKAEKLGDVSTQIHTFTQ